MTTFLPPQLLLSVNMCTFGQLISRYETRGMARKDAEAVVFKMAMYENFFVSQVVSDV